MKSKWICILGKEKVVKEILRNVVDILHIKNKNGEEPIDAAKRRSKMFKTWIFVQIFRQFRFFFCS